VPLEKQRGQKREEGAVCIDCGCGSSGEARFRGTHAHLHGEDDDHGPQHDHDHEREGSAGSVSGANSRRLTLEQAVLQKNDHFARENRGFFKASGILALNLLSSPGAGKTTLIEKSLLALEKTFQNSGRSFPLAVIEGDQATSRDADRIRSLGIPALQINTGKGCHLDAHQIGHASRELRLSPGSVLVIENIGNLVCPALFDLGESAKIVLFSVTEGEDKPLKYPQMFQEADLVLLTKTDLLPYLDFDREVAVNYVRAMNPKAGILALSSRTGEGMEEWLEWIVSLRNGVGNDSFSSPAV